MKLNHARSIVKEPKYLEALKTIAEAEAEIVEEDLRDEAEVEAEVETVEED